MRSCIVDIAMRMAVDDLFRQYCCRPVAAFVVFLGFVYLSFSNTFVMAGCYCIDACPILDTIACAAFFLKETIFVGNARLRNSRHEWNSYELKCVISEKVSNVSRKSCH